MSHKGIILAISIFCILIVGMFVFAFLKKGEIRETPNVEVTKTTASPYDSITRIDGKHFIVNGKHTVVGEVLMPTPCDLLDWDTTVGESLPEQVRIDFTAVNSTDACVQTVTPQKFFVEFTASPEALIHARLNGREIILNLIPALQGETPDNYEYAPKG